MKNLVIGASGQLGYQIYNQLHPDVLGTSFSNNDFYKLDISNEEQIKELSEKISPEVIYLTAAATNVDWCEQNPELSKDINVRSVVNFTKYFSFAKIVFFSSDYVFPGCGQASEIDIPDPLQTYGKHKLIAELMLRESSNKFLILRTNMIYGFDPNGKNYSSRLIKSLKEGKVFNAVDDEIVTPSYNKDIAKQAIYLQNLFCGTYHLTGADICTRYSFSIDLAEKLGLDKNLINPISVNDLNLRAKRPVNGGLKSNFISPLRGYKEVFNKEQF